MRVRFELFAVAVASTFVFGQVAHAQTPEEPKVEPPETDPRQEEARAHFQKGVSLFGERAWDAALAEFLRSRELFPTRAATKNAAVCLRQLRRFDEAVEYFETLLREFPNLPDAERAEAERELSELEGYVGAIIVQGAPPGASVVVDGRERANALAGPVRVPSGSHVVRVYQAGYVPFETRVEVAGRQMLTVKVELRALTQSGTLQVVEQSGKSVEVVVDGAIVGKTPWEGELAPGDHTVFLRGEGELGTQPVAAPVARDRPTRLTLAIEPLDAGLRVKPIPGGASVAIDGVTVGRGLWSGRLRGGPHRVEVMADGFVPATRDVTLARRREESLEVRLERDLDSPAWGRRSRFVVGADVLFALVPSLGGDVAGACSGDCSRSLGVGTVALARLGYELGSGLGFGIDVGYALISQSVTDRATTIKPLGLEAQPGTADDELLLSGMVVGAQAAYHGDGKVRLTAGLGVGALLGTLRDERSGTFTDRAGDPYSVELTSSPSARYLYVHPEVRVGIPLGDRFELHAGASAFVLVALTQPTWDESESVDVTDGRAEFAAEALTGKTVFALTPGIGARYSF